MLKIVADDNISLLEEYFSPHGHVTSLPGRNITRNDVVDADVLLVRSVTRVDAALLSGSKVKFVGSCTIGTDHLDTAWLDQQGIHWTNAPGCNADAVVDYVLACLFALDIDLQQMRNSGFTVGVVGCGNVGSRLVKRLQKIGINTLCCDPYKRSRHYVSLETLIPQCDVVCLHTPLTQTGKHPTFHLVNELNLPLFKEDAILLNAGRGAVIDNTALLKHMNRHPEFRTILDVWENEPVISTALLLAASIATPHIAGYSVEGKRRGTETIHEAFCHYFNIAGAVAVNAEEPLEFDARHFSSLRELVLACYDPLKDTAELKHAPQAFDQFRKFYVYRREFSACRLRRAPRELKLLLKSLGFKLFQWRRDSSSR
jgi:erythronate-4-phosphate dehydrogenase